MYIYTYIRLMEGQWIILKNNGWKNIGLYWHNLLFKDRIVTVGNYSFVTPVGFFLLKPIIFHTFAFKIF